MKLKKIIPYVAWSILMIAVLISVAFVSARQETVKCNAVLIQVEESNGNYFIENNDVEELLNSKGKQPLGKPMNEINTALLETIINSNPFVANAEVFSTLDGKLHINVKQRNPLIRIINTSGESFYIDEEGYLMPVSDKYTPNVIVASGNINEQYTRRRISNAVIIPGDTSNSRMILEQLLVIAKFLQKDTVSNALFTQVFVNENNELELIPRIGDQRIIIADAGNLEKKISKLLLFYREGLNNTGWTPYSIINLKFEGQVVCTKKGMQPSIALPADSTGQAVAINTSGVSH